MYGKCQGVGVPIKERVGVGLHRQGTVSRHRKITARSENEDGMGGGGKREEIPSANSTSSSDLCLDLSQISP